jgi:hypothetical protein
MPSRNGTGFPVLADCASARVENDHLSAWGAMAPLNGVVDYIFGTSLTLSVTLCPSLLDFSGTAQPYWHCQLPR